MKKSERADLRTIVLLAAVLAGLAAFYFWKTVPDAGKLAQKGKVFLLDTRTPSSIGVLDVTVLDTNSVGPSTNTHRVILERKNAGWEIQHPWQESADPEPVQQSVNDLMALKSENILTNDGGELANSLGFPKPWIEAAITWKDGTRTEIVSGGLTSDGRYAYVMRSGDPAVYLVSAYKFRSLARSPHEYRAKNVFSILPDGVAELSVVNRRRIRYRFRSVRDGQSYVLLEPERLPAEKLDRIAVKALLIDLAGLSVSRFMTNADPVVREIASVRLSTKNGLTQEIRIGKPDGEGEYPVLMPHRQAAAWIDGAGLTNVLDLRTEDVLLLGEKP